MFQSPCSSRCSPSRCRRQSRAGSTSQMRMRPSRGIFDAGRPRRGALPLLTACEESMRRSSGLNGRRVVGVLLVLVAAALSLGQEWAIRRDLGYAAAVGPRVDAVGDSAMRASIDYHAANARAAERARWSPRGHGTLGVAGVLAGLAILVTARRRDRAF